MYADHGSRTCHFLPSAVLLILAISLVSGHQKVVIDSGSQVAEGLINRMISLSLSSPPYIHQATTSIPDDSRYIIIHPATIYPTPAARQNYLMLPTNEPSLLDELRSYRSAHYRDIVVFEGWVFLHLGPDRIVVVRENGDAVAGGLGGMANDYFHVENIYKLDGLTQKSETKMYRIRSEGELAVLMVVSNSPTLYRLGIKQSYKYTLPQNNEISHLQFIGDNEFIAATRHEGIKFYRIVDGAIKVVKEYSCAQLGLAGKQRALKDDDVLRADEEVSLGARIKNNADCYIPDFGFNATTMTLYILDQKSGLHETKIKKSSSQPPSYELSPLIPIAQIKECQALDSVSSDHFVLVCQVSQPTSYIQEIIRFPDPVIPDKFVYIKKDPLYHDCKLNDLAVSEDFFLIFDSFTIDVFWNSIKTGSTNELSTEHSKQHFNMPGLEVFSLYRDAKKDQLFLYVVQSNVLLKYQLVIFTGRVFAYSPTAIKKQIKLQIPGKCNQSHPILTNNKEINQNTECLYQTKILLNIQEKIEVASKEKVSMSIGAIAIMLVVLLILTWICLAKYRGLEGHARKILEKYRQRNRYAENKFTI